MALIKANVYSEDVKYVFNMISDVWIYYEFTLMLSAFLFYRVFNWAPEKNTYCSWPTQYKYVQ